MEHKLWVKIFALLLLGLSALALHDNETSPHNTAAPAAPGPALTPGPTTAGPESGASLDESSVSNNNSTETGPSSSLNDTTEEAGTIGTNSSEIPEVNGTIPAEDTSLPASENQTSATQSQPTTASTTLSSTNKTETLSPPTSASHLENSSTSQSEAPLQTFTPPTQLIPSTRTLNTTTMTTLASPTRATTTASTTSSTTTTTTTTTALESTQAPAAKEKATHVQSDGVSHKAITPSQLNVGEETTVVHESPTLDPLLAGLVSAFIIAAVIITLLLFLKLRRRDTRPEFRRLQDLPMDDMMEDTPLSMYSY